MSGGSTLECPVCYRAAGCFDKLVTCSNGHYCCENCRERCRACPLCRDGTSVRNLMAEHLLSTCLVVCETCGQSHAPGEPHTCTDLPPCPVGCGWRGLPGAHRQHIVQTHCVPCTSATTFSCKVTRFPFQVIVGSNPARLVQFQERDEVSIAIWCIAVGSMGDSAPRVSVKITSAMLTINAMLRVTDCDANAQALILAKDTVLFAIEYDALTVSINASCH